ncbi:TPA: polyribonucleotide nucleotidyltransferase [Candidatus Dependentiae bacterium]|nr:MAG: Polyribonucleotide nucleotidyltransferase [candidate division TM6 bacterium GW2011_GWE2_31_21]KKP54051.1 MAG: Polyribonucleotide nucleotidyltransferase [candidate division TM6 bacterium GW2011_GWF2_33_332]HBS48366.1 polyribonucleotide nucleotidyltransferase [Candidatus Dependentiae bacterium]HBZ72960.1 polyribonucleotide nucleotidyltransferase [Candidatus Dependentiae bacterium]
MNKYKKYRLDRLGLEVELGKYAKQADGAAWVKHGNNIVLTTAVVSKEQKDFVGFFPLTVEYRERTSAVGKFPGGFIKREGRLADRDVLSSRLIDRSIRPLFPETYYGDVQVISTVFSSDGKHPVDILGLLAASIALVTSRIPFLEPVGAVRVGRINGEWKTNISYEESLISDVSLTVAGIKDAIMMVEGDCKNITESELIEALTFAHEEIKLQVEWQLEIQKDFPVEKYEIVGKEKYSSLKEKIKAILPHEKVQTLFGKSKDDISDAMDNLKKFVIENFAAEIESGTITKQDVLFSLDLVFKNLLPDVIAKKGSRFDGRNFDQIRPLLIEAGILPCVHGSALFQRGETQALVSVTLGTAQDAQKEEQMFGGVIDKTFMLHYNFPPYSTGEVKPMRGLSRRDIGHGHLAESSFYNVLPDKEAFPYTIRSISDVLESNGSSSMATVCGTTLALMDAGVPIKDLVSGVAMGLIKDSSGKLHVLTDILGMEDAFGLMDFKITGTEAGIMAVQMDIKEKLGLSREVLANALEQARVGRLFLLSQMKKVLSAPRPEISKNAPRILAYKVPVDKIGAIIGPSGKNIKEIIATTGVEMDIDDDGSVRIYSKDSKSAEEALAYVKGIIGEVEIGAVYKGKIKKYIEFGIIVDIFPGKGGLIHVSSIAKNLQKDLDKRYTIDSSIDVKVIAFDRDTGRIRLVAPELQDGASGDNKHKDQK